MRQESAVGKGGSEEKHGRDGEAAQASERGIPERFEATEIKGKTMTAVNQWNRSDSLGRPRTDRS
jgi:hypothetical protein